MKKFLVIYYTPASAKMAKPTPEQQAKVMEEWTEWIGNNKEQISDIGAPLFPAATVAADGTRSAGNNTVGGYSILQAASVDGLKKSFENHPHHNAAPGCTIEISEFMPM